MGNYAWQCNYCEKPYHLGPCDQPAGVRVDAAMIERLRYALRMYDERRTTMQSLASSVGDFLRDVAVLHPEQAKDGAAG